jgi:two-component system, LytTR family, response regulator
MNTIPSVPLRALIADDMPLARQHLRRHLHGSGRAQVVAECADGAAVAEAARAARPDVLFLDIHMPGLDGFGALDRVAALGIEPAPQLVFVTAFEQHALRAFDARAADYLLKPIDPARLDRALDRVLALRGAALRSTDNAGALLRLRVEGGWRFVRAQDIRWAQSRGNTLVVAVGDERLATRITLAAFETLAGGSTLLRIHRSTLVQLRRVVAVRPRVNGDQEVTLDSGERFTASRRCREALLAALDGHVEPITPPRAQAGMSRGPPR